jgi:TRAP-type mannitol/chloroaromatic compound transport system permease small subunit
MKPWIAIATAIDAVNETIGRAVLWLVLAVTLISAANALMRYGFGMSSNAWLEIQWYLFGAIFLLAAGYTLKHNGHVRIDVIYGRLSQRTRAWIDLLGALLFLLPLCGLMVWLAWPGFVDSFRAARCRRTRRAYPLASAPADSARVCSARLAGRG